MQGSSICESGERLSQAHNVKFNNSAGTIHPTLYMTIYNILSFLQAHFFSDLYSQAQNTFNEAWVGGWPKWANLDVTYLLNGPNHHSTHTEVDRAM